MAEVATRPSAWIRVATERAEAAALVETMQQPMHPMALRRTPLRAEHPDPAVCPGQAAQLRTLHQAVAAVALGLVRERPAIRVAAVAQADRLDTQARRVEREAQASQEAAGLRGAAPVA
jgi:hypothetical protein